MPTKKQIADATNISPAITYWIKFALAGEIALISAKPITPINTARQTKVTQKEIDSDAFILLFCIIVLLLVNIVFVEITSQFALFKFTIATNARIFIRHYRAASFHLLA